MSSDHTVVKVALTAEHFQANPHHLHHLNGGLFHCRIPDIATEDLMHLAILGLEQCRALVEEGGRNPGSSVDQGFQINTSK
ncbi:hypothetical protein IFM47457_03381 [Aspergillus lentulus]|nr:hypothetical protein IFM47457_03381 [Aspergillus lentulus]